MAKLSGQRRSQFGLKGKGYGTEYIFQPLLLHLQKSFTKQPHSGRPDA
jgi:hypothetical protein